MSMIFAITAQHGNLITCKLIEGTIRNFFRFFSLLQKNGELTEAKFSENTSSMSESLPFNITLEQ